MAKFHGQKFPSGFLFDGHQEIPFELGVPARVLHSCILASLVDQGQQRRRIQAALQLCHLGSLCLAFALCPRFRSGRWSSRRKVEVARDGSETSDLRRQEGLRGEKALDGGGGRVLEQRGRTRLD